MSDVARLGAALVLMGTTALSIVATGHSVAASLVTVAAGCALAQAVSEIGPEDASTGGGKA